MPDVSAQLASPRPDTLAAAQAFLAAAPNDPTGYHPSPTDWRDEVLYFLMPDRFSDGRERAANLLTRGDIQALRQNGPPAGWQWSQWAESGKLWQGGTIKGITSKLGYLKDLGMTTIWVGPIFKQRARLDTYHGYGIQDFLEVDPRFGTREDLVELVAKAHAKKIRIILDIIINHSGDNWGYVPPGEPLSHATNDVSYQPWAKHYGPTDPERRDWQLAWRQEVNNSGFTVDPAAITQPHDGVWPRELQDAARYTRAGGGDSDRNLGYGDYKDDRATLKRTDFLALKDFALDVGKTMDFLCDCFRYWIALTDCDGFRIDTVKHISLEEARNFCGAIQEYAESLGKHNFLLAGEIAGGDDPQDYYLDELAVMQRNLSAALDIGNARLSLTRVGKGESNAGAYLNGFKTDDAGFGSHRAVGTRHVSVLDDHDLVFKIDGKKFRFSTLIPDDHPVKDYQVVVPTAMQLFTLGIPCVYYGTEQAFAGPPASETRWLEGWGSGSHDDRYLREAMFGPTHPRAPHEQDLPTQVGSVDVNLPGFGPYGTAGKHCFDKKSPSYLAIQALATVRAGHPVLRLGRQYARQLRLPGTGFIDSYAGQVVAWSRLLAYTEALCVANANGSDWRGGDVVVSGELWQPGDTFEVLANTALITTPGYTGPYTVGSTITAMGRGYPDEPVYLPIRDLPPCAVLVLIRSR